MATTEGQIKTRELWALDTNHSGVEFAVKHLVVATVRGRFTRYQVDIDFDEANPERSTVEARIDAASITTGVDDRDAHLRSPDFLDAETFSEIVFKSSRITGRGGDRYLIVGDLTIRDLTRESVLDATLGRVGKNPWGQEVAGFSAETKINRKDYGLNWNAALETGGWLVGDDIKISLELEAIKQEG
jgi:polyisoprenoid-binding protein YceI